MARRKTHKIGPEKRRTCTRCGRVGHLAGKCEAPEKRHKLVGIEIEGYWLDLVAAQRQAMEILGRQGNSDGSLPQSVDQDGDDQADQCPDCEEDLDDCVCDEPDANGVPPVPQQAIPRPWEFQTTPGSLGESLRQLVSMYPDFTNRSCGMHVHLSFLDPSDVTLLAGEGFFKYFRAEFKKWGEAHSVKGAFWDRLDGRNNYCRINTDDDWTRRRTPGFEHKKGAPVTSQSERYRQINFQAWSEHQTVEFRLLPMFAKASLAVSAVEALIEIVESWLAQASVDHEIAIEVPSVAGTFTEIAPVEIAIDPAAIHLGNVGEMFLDLPEVPAKRAGVEVLPRTQVRKRVAKLLEDLEV